MPKKQTISEKLQAIKDKFSIDVELIQSTDGVESIQGNCDVHGTFTRPLFGAKHKKYLCDSCGIDSRHNSNRDNAKSQIIPIEELIQQFRLIHGDLFEYSRSADSRKVDVMCKVHGQFSMFIISHKKGAACPLCKKQAIVDKRIANKLLRLSIGKRNVILANKNKTIPKELILNMFREKHGDKFEYIWENFTGKSGSVIVVCPDHGNTTQIIDEHIRSVHGCRYCANYSISTAETKWLESICVTDTQKVIYHPGGLYKVDGYDVATNTVYEYFGDYWHGHPRLWIDPLSTNSRCKKLFSELFTETNTRLETIHKLGYKIKYVWESEMVVREYDGSLKFNL